MPRPTLFGPSGQRIRADDSIWPHAETSTNAMRIRVTQVKDTTAAVTPRDWTRQLSLSRQLYGRMGMVSGSIGMIGTFAVGSAWQPQFKGQDRKWGALAEEWLFHWFKRCNVRGQPFTFQRSLRNDSVALDRDGDSAMVFVTGADGEPLMQWVSAHRIGSRVTWGQDVNGFATVPSGPYKGRKCYNGVIMGPALNPVAYSILGDTEAADRQIPVESCQLLYEPDWSDQGRGISRVVAAMVDWCNLDDIQYFLKRQVKQDSSMGILHYNESGYAPDPESDGSFVAGNSGLNSQVDVSVEEKEGNEILYMKAMGGGKIEPYRSGRPEANVMAFLAALRRACHMGLRWPVELTDPSTIGGASTRLIQDIARRTIQDRQETLMLRANRAVMWGLSVAMDRGELPRNSGDWWNWGFTLPAKLTVDARYDAKSALEKIRMAAGTYASLYGEEGSWWQEEIDQRIAEQKYITERCAEAGVDPDKVQMLTPNGNPQKPAEENGNDSNETNGTTPRDDGTGSPDQD